MYSVLKGQMVPTDENARQIIDSNERMQQIIEAQMEELRKQAEQRRQQTIMDYLNSLEGDEEGKPIIPRDEEGNEIFPFDEEGNQLLYLHSDGFLYDEEEEIIEEPEEEEIEEPEPEPEPEEPPINREEILAEIQKEGDEILARANAEAEDIINKANESAQAMQAEVEELKAETERLKEQAIEEARTAGHDEGYNAGYEEAAAKAQAEYADKVSELEADFAGRKEEIETQLKQAEETYRAGEEDMEQNMADIFCDIIDKVFKIEFSGKKEIILHLVDNVITNTPGSKEYMIRVNESNYGIINEHRQELIEKVGTGVALDIIKDPLMGGDECMIETDGGVYDCGMDTQLSNLLADLKALSLV